MLEFKSYSSSSSGNLNVIRSTATGARVMLDCGLTLKQMLARKIKTSWFDGCLITHRHSDHCKGAKTLIRHGIDIYAGKDVVEHLECKNHHRAHVVEPKVSFSIGNINFLPFSLEHDVPTLGFLMMDDEGDKAVYITDTAYCESKFNNLSIIAIECNYTNIDKGLSAFQQQRVYGSHMGLERTLKFIKANNNKRLRAVHLLHLSDTNADAGMMYSKVKELVGQNVFVKIAEK
jgi:phosphoribosyl 1,2-cyclic phosphodiesterase